MGNGIQNNPGRVIRTTKSTCNKDLKSKIFVPSKTDLPTKTEITLFAFLINKKLLEFLKKCTFICFLPSFFSIVDATCLTFLFSSEPLPLTSSDSAISG